MTPGAPDAAAVPAPGRGWLTRNLVVLSGVSFLQDSASELLYPIMPIFLTTVLGAPPAVVGAVEGVAEAVAAGTKVLAGRLAGRVGRRRLVAAGYGLAAVGKLVIALAFVWPVVLCGRAIDRLGKGIRGAPRDALLAEGIAPTALGRAFGLHRTADTLGAVVGPLIGLAGYELFHHRIRPLLVIAVVPAVASVALVGAVRGSSGATATAPVPVDRGGGGPLPAPFWRTLRLVTAFGLVNFPDALLLLRVKALGFSVAGVILVYVTYNAVYALASFPSGWLADRVAPPRVFAFGLVCFAACYVGLGLVTRRALVWPLFAVYGGYTAATDGVGKAWVTRLVPHADRARAQGLFQGIGGGATLVAGLWAGLLWHGTGRIPLVASGVLALVVAAAIVVRGDALLAAVSPA